MTDEAADRIANLHTALAVAEACTAAVAERARARERVEVSDRHVVLLARIVLREAGETIPDGDEGAIEAGR